MKASELITELQNVITNHGDIEAAYMRPGRIPMSLGVHYVAVCGVADSEKKFAVMAEDRVNPMQPAES